MRLCEEEALPRVSTCRLGIAVDRASRAEGAVPAASRASWEEGAGDG